ncbi:MAG TPA: oligopeptide:H+ symporter [Pirellulales bacterium]|nr:oligopeptide:H+ symporter [Pirellulales bacterium]
MSTAEPQRETLFGHPAGLYTLFFAEMWERFSYYGMRALLVFYMSKGFLQYVDAKAITVYGAYTALVYMTPFFGGMLADKLLGARRAVVLGGTLMALGQLMLTVQEAPAFYTGLSLLIVGNGFFKPNISTIVGSLYPQNSVKRDGGFTIFYMGINLGAAMSPLLCGYVGEIYGWDKGFGLAAIGMMSGLAVFVVPGVVAQLLILASALAGACGLFYFYPNNPISAGINLFVGLSLLAAAGASLVAIGRGGLPQSAGAPPASQPGGKGSDYGQLGMWVGVLAGTVAAIPLFALLVSGFGLLRERGETLVLIPESTIEALAKSENSFARSTAVVAEEASKPAGLVLVLAGLVAAAYLGIETLRLDRVRRQRMFVVLILTFFVMLFFAFFEQAGSSLNLFTDRNVDRVFEAADARVIGPDDVSSTVMLQPTQEQLGYTNGGKLFTIKDLTALREANAEPDFEISWTVDANNVGMRIARRANEIPASIFQSVNPVYIIVLGLVVTAIWSFLGARGLEPSTPLKFALGLLLLGLSFLSFWYGAQSADPRGMVNVAWLVLGYLLQTLGELCLSPVGLSMITKLSPQHLVSTVMGSWFLATAFSQYLAAIIAQFTSVEDKGAGAFPAPIDTVHIYGDVYLKIAIASIASAAVCFVLVPVLKRWMHAESES